MNLSYADFFYFSFKFDDKWDTMDHFVSIYLVLAFTSTCHLVESSSINQFEGTRELQRRSGKILNKL